MELSDFRLAMGHFPRRREVSLSTGVARSAAPTSPTPLSALRRRGKERQRSIVYSPPPGGTSRALASADGHVGNDGPADRTESIATIHAALEAGITLPDTGDFHGSGHNEMLIGESLTSRKRSAADQRQMRLCRDPAGGWGACDAQPAAMKSLSYLFAQRLGVDRIEINRPARLNPKVPIEETVGAIAR